VKTSTDCERVRLTLMASLDGESDARSAPDQQHLSTCESCRGWLEDMQAMTGRLHGLSYPAAQMDLWTAVGSRIRQPRLRQGYGEAGERRSLLHRLWPVVAIVLGWRAFQLFVDLPIPLLHPLVPLLAAVVAVWVLEGDPLAIETSAPELQKRGI
jgi:predicted anti-sigma-YlaC factor YlaD